MGKSDRKYQELISKYKLIKEFKKSGQKKVALVEHIDYGPCILKVGKSNSDTANERAKREVTLQNILDSKYYPKILKCCFEPECYWYFEEYIGPKTLNDEISFFKNDPKSSLLMIKEIVFGLTPLWNRGIAHRDIKPDNILLSKENNPVIIDFGIIKDPKQESVTLSFYSMGPCTPRFGAPEQLCNNKKLIGPRSDQIALGIILHMLCTGGEHPYDPSVTGSGVNAPENIIQNILSLDKLDNSAVPDCIKTITAKLLGHMPYERFRNAEMLIKAIENCEGGL